MKCDLDNMTTYLLRGHLSARGLSPEQTLAVSVQPCEGGSMEHLASIRCADENGDREVRKVATLEELNLLVNDKAELDRLADDVRGVLAA